MASPQRKARATASHPIYEKAQIKWRSSGLTDEHASKLGLRPLTAEEVRQALGIDRPQPCGLLIPYFDMKGKQTDFFRIRFLDLPPGFAGLVEKPQRYAQQAKTLNEIYLPPLTPASWEDIAQDSNVAIYITEGELKAAAAASVGLACVGLGGVDVWRSTKRGIELLPQLAEITWKNRQIVIVYDSDAATNPNVVRAQRQLAKEMTALGAMPNVASLPPTKDGKKQGLDDYLLAHGADELIQLVSTSPAFPEADALWGLNEEVVYVRDPGLVIDLKTAQKMKPGDFTIHAYANRHYLETIHTDKGVQTKRKSLAKRWIDWEHRSEMRKLTYAPGKPKRHGQAFNTWPGWGCEPVKGDIAPWSWLLDHIFKGEPEMRRWFEQWCAYPLQHPGVKLYTYVLLWSIAQGTGKSFLSYVLKGIYGENGIEIDSEALRESFNDWAENRQLVVGDEITANDARMDRDKLKSLITRPEIRINQKFLPKYRIPDCINYIFNSNQPDALFLEDKDRRGFIWHLPEEKVFDKAFWDRADKWLNGDAPNSHKGPGVAHLFHHLLSVDLTGFTPTMSAPLTSARTEMILGGKSDVGMWVLRMKEDQYTTIRPLGEAAAKNCDLFTARQLRRCYDPEDKTRVTDPGMGRELARAGVFHVNEACGVRTRSCGVVKLYAVRNVAKWKHATPAQMADHFESFFGEKGRKV